MKKVQLDNSGVVVKHRSPGVSKPVRSRPPAPTVQHESITAEFVREVKDELVKELAALIVGAGITAVKNIIHKPDEISGEPVTITKPIVIDDSVVVTEVSVGQVQKGFSEITEAKITKDESVSTSIDKLRSIKKGS
jgi:hypothetical protein